LHWWTAQNVENFSEQQWQFGSHYISLELSERGESIMIISTVQEWSEALNIANAGTSLAEWQFNSTVTFSKVIKNWSRCSSFNFHHFVKLTQQVIFDIVFSQTKVTFKNQAFTIRIKFSWDFSCWNILFYIQYAILFNTISAINTY
jgi:hypothetical protein